MILKLDIERLRTLEKVRAFTEGSAPVGFRPAGRDHAFEH